MTQPSTEERSVFEFTHAFMGNTDIIRFTGTYNGQIHIIRYDNLDMSPGMARIAQTIPDTLAADVELTDGTAFVMSGTTVTDALIKVMRRLRRMHDQENR